MKIMISFFMAVLIALYPVSVTTFAETSISQINEKINLPKPANIKTSSTNNTVTLTWDKVKGASAYRVYMLNKSDGKYHKYKTVKRTKCTITGLKTDMEYSFFIQTLSLANNKYAAHEKTGRIKVRTKSTYFDFIEDLKKKHGIASTKSFTASKGSVTLDFPDNIAGYISKLVIDLDGNGTDELLILRAVIGEEAASFGAEVDGPIIIAEIYKTENDKIVLSDSKSITNMFYCEGSNFYLYFSEQLKKYCLVCESGTFANITGINTWDASIYTVTANSVDYYDSWYNVSIFSSEFVDIEEKMLLIGAPYAENSTTFDNRTSALYYKSLCQIKHNAFNLSDEDMYKYNGIWSNTLQIISGDSEAAIKNKPDSYFKNILTLKGDT